MTREAAMGPTPLEARRDCYERLAPVWPTLLHDVHRFATAAPDPVTRCGRLEVFAFLTALPQRVEGQAQRQADRATATNGHARPAAR